MLVEAACDWCQDGRGARAGASAISERTGFALWCRTGSLRCNIVQAVHGFTIAARHASGLGAHPVSRPALRLGSGPSCRLAAAIPAAEAQRLARRFEPGRVFERAVGSSP